MMKRNKSHMPDDLHRVADYLERNRYEPSPLDLDRLKLRTMAQLASSSQQKGIGMRSKLVPILLVLGVALCGGTGGVIAAGGGASNGSAARSEYTPGKGCGDKNHTHTGPPGNPDYKPCPTKKQGNVKGESISGGGGDGEGVGGAGGVAGSTASGGNSGNSQAKSAGNGSRLPFTGFVVGLLAIGGVALLSSGLALRRRTGPN